MGNDIDVYEERVREQEKKDNIAAYNAIANLHWGINSSTNNSIDTAGDNEHFEDS